MPEAQDVPNGPGSRAVAGLLPTPTTVSPKMQKLVAAPPRPAWKVQPRTHEEWRSLVEGTASQAIARLPLLCDRLGVAYERTSLGGVPAFRVMPREVAPENRGRLLLHIHGGCYVMFPGESGVPEAIRMAGFGRFEILSIDYRMPPLAFFPAALEDVVAGWEAALRLADPRQMAVFGTSAGGALTLELVLRAKARPAAARCARLRHADVGRHEDG